VQKQLRPFWTFFGGKWRIAPRYPSPIHSTIIEPFAGAAGYSLRYADRKIILVEKDPLIAGIWRWLLRVSEKEVRALPCLPESGKLDDAIWPCEEAKNLAGFWITRGAAHPNKSASAWMRDPRYRHWSWGEMSIERIASQVDRIRHWRLVEGDYGSAPNETATWFIDPPYAKAGLRYRCSSRDLDFTHLSSFCRSRRGQVIVCEQEGADWLPFQFFHKAKANESVNGGKISNEVIWIQTEKTRHTVNGDQGNGWYCYGCGFFSRRVDEAAAHDGTVTTA
jgi:hypothetical protein